MGKISSEWPLTGGLVRRVVNAVDPHATFGNAAIPTDLGYSVGWHVTDDPYGAADALVRGVKVTLKHRGTFQDLGPGLYVSAVPEYWISRSSRKWEFLKRLDGHQRRRLALAILKHPNIRELGYISKSERRSALRDLRAFVETGRGEYITHLAGQPYNIRFWQPSFLRPLEIEPGGQPVAVEVRFVGCYAELSRYPTAREFGRLYSFNLDGAFLSGGFAADPQLVIWRNKAIIRFGDIDFPSVYGREGGRCHMVPQSL